MTNQIQILKSFLLTTNVVLIENLESARFNQLRVTNDIQLRHAVITGNSQGWAMTEKERQRDAQTEKKKESKSQRKSEKHQEKQTGRVREDVF